MDDKRALINSQAGMRFIAQMTIYNRGDFERLRGYIAESYHADLLAAEPVDARLAALRTMYETHGKLRVQQVLGTDPHHVVVLVAAEKCEGYAVIDVQVEPEHPHAITGYAGGFGESSRED